MTDDRPQQRPEPEPIETEAERRRNNIYLGLFAVAVIVIGIWLVNGLVDARKADECISSGSRACKRIDVTPRE